MSSRRYRTDAQQQGDEGRGGGGIAPGKRAMTSALPPPRDTVDFFRAGEYRESRATIDGATPTSSRLTDSQMRKARERNPYWQNKLGFSPSLFGGGEVDTGEFADNVADKQAGLGVAVDGIAGPDTVEAAAAAHGAAQDQDRAFEATRGRRDPDGAARRATPGGMDGEGDFYDSRATIDGPPAGPYAGEDPFAMHLIGNK
jgi:hypothetical protein